MDQAASDRAALTGGNGETSILDIYDVLGHESDKMRRERGRGPAHARQPS
jgi:hypothetical protein